ncbi:MAG: hypothetical protein IH859_06140, partial [Chloroflexi bacterium]|nr:hypothetical protein [Chloroflexota bacterium]
MNFAEVEVSHANGAYHASREGLELVIPADRGKKAAAKGKVIMGIRPEDIVISSEGISGEFHGVEPLGRDHLIDVIIGNVHFYSLADPSLTLKSGDMVKLKFNTNKSQFFDMKTERSLLWN